MKAELLDNFRAHLTEQDRPDLVPFVDHITYGKLTLAAEWLEDHLALASNAEWIGVNYDEASIHLIVYLGIKALGDAS